MSQDALMAQGVSTTTPGVFLRFTWTDWNGVNFTVDYYFNGNQMFRRLNGVQGPLVAENIVTDPAHTNCSWNAATNTVTVNIRTSLNINKRFADGTFQVHPRPSVGG
jgi:hypothetical protein